MKSSQASSLLQKALNAHRAGDIGTAAQLYQQIIAIEPRHADAYQLLGVIAQQMGKSDLARHLMEKALEFQPNHIQALTNLAVLLRAAGELEHARARAEAAITIDPHNPDACIALGGVLAAQRDFAAARNYFRRAEKFQPDNLALLNDIATAERRLGNFVAAQTVIKHALALQPDNPMLHNTQGNILRASGYPDLAVSAFTRAIQLDPTLSDARHNAALMHLLLGDFTRGWELYATRGKADARYDVLIPWDGKQAAPLLVRAEQGLGDTLQCVRYVKRLQAIVPQLVLEVQSPLLRLIHENFPNLPVITADMPLPAGITHHSRLLDLPQWFGYGSHAPYLTAPDLPPALANLLAKHTAPRIGLVWGGNPGHLNDANRSLKLEQLTAVLALYTPHIISLQKGPQTAELARCGIDITDAGAWLEDFATTAALVRQLDLVISVDTSVAHLAGGLGVPVWLLLPYDPDWRWLLQRQDTPWYPAMTLFRQQQPMDWSAPLALLAAQLGKFIGGDRTCLTAPAWTESTAQRPEMPVKLA